VARVPGCDLDTLPCCITRPEHAARDIMADLAGPSTNAGARRFLAHWDRRFHSLQSRVARYGFAIVSVTVALGLSLALQYYQFRGVEVPVLALAIAVTTWYAGNGPAVLAIILSSLCFDYFFTEPYYSLEITSRDLPYFFIFVISNERPNFDEARAALKAIVSAGHRAGEIARSLPFDIQERKLKRSMTQNVLEFPRVGLYCRIIRRTAGAL
jgi:hypothetical protein